MSELVEEIYFVCHGTGGRKEAIQVGTFPGSHFLLNPPQGSN